MFNTLNEYYWSAREDKDTGEWIVDCTPIEDAEELQFTFYGTPKATFTFKLQHFIDKVGDKCVLRIRSMRLDDMEPDRWVFGLPFFRKYCALLDLGLGTSKLRLGSRPDERAFSRI